MYTVDLVQLIEKMNLENCTPDIDIKNKNISAGCKQACFAAGGILVTLI